MRRMLRLIFSIFNFFDLVDHNQGHNTCMFIVMFTTIHEEMFVQKLPGGPEKLPWHAGVSQASQGIGRCIECM